MMRRGLLGGATALVSMTAIVGCSLSTLQFRSDKRLHFVSPHTLQRVSTPFTLSWTMRDFTPSGLTGSASSSAGEFALFIDRAPIKVGENLRAVAKGDPSCRINPMCPDAAYLAARNIYLTMATSLEVPTLPKVTTGGSSAEHYVNVVLINGKGERFSESSWFLEFTSANTGRSA